MSKVGYRNLEGWRERLYESTEPNPLNDVEGNEVPPASECKGIGPSLLEIDGLNREFISEIIECPPNNAGSDLFPGLCQSGLPRRHPGWCSALRVVLLEVPRSGGCA
jgi:hypothetical protein